MKEHERAREIGERLGEMDERDVWAKLNGLSDALNASALVLECLHSDLKNVTKERDNFFKFYTDNEKELAAIKLALQGMADALREVLGCAVPMKEPWDKARAALDAAKPFLESK